MTQFAGITMMRMDGEHVRTIKTDDIGGDVFSSKRSNSSG